jgi:5-methylcytosine-specific restriction protein A
MAMKAKRFCNWPGCNELSSDTYCPEHAKRAESKYSHERGSAASQGYDRDWQRVRLAYLRLHPLCEACDREGLTVPATIVHHVKAIKDSGDRLSISNLMAVCHACHEAIEGPNRWKKRR